MAVIDEYLIFGGFNRDSPTYTLRSSCTMAFSSARRSLPGNAYRAVSYVSS